MAKKVTINIATVEGLRKASGSICILSVGDRKHRFLLQSCEHTGGVDVLTHIASGQIVCKGLKAAAIRFHCNGGDRCIAIRDAARDALVRLIDKAGADLVNERLDNAPVVNK